jgi:leucyl-tRNA synthetase
MAEYDYNKIEQKWQKKWEGLGKAEPDQREKFFLIFAYPGVSGYLHVGHMRGYTYSDVICRYKRMLGYNVLFPVGTHATGNLAYSFAKKIERGDQEFIANLRANGCSEDEIKKLKDPMEVVRFFNDVFVNDYWKKFGFIADYSRFTTTINPDYNKFIEWQFKKLKEKDLLVQKPYFATFCVNCGPIAVDASETDISKGGNAEQQEFTLLKFRFGDEFIIAATLRPETVYGQTNLWVDPNITYVKAKVGDETWIASKECAEKLKYQKEKIEIAGEIAGREMIGKYCTAPEINRELIILPSKFCDPKIGTGIVTSVPSDAPYDWMGLVDLMNDEMQCRKYGLDPQKIKAIEVIPIIVTKEFGDKAALKICEEMSIKNSTDKKLEEATKLVYKAGFHTGRMNDNCGEFAGMPVMEAKDKMKQKMLDSGQADTMQELSEEVVCRCGGPVVIKKIDDQWFIKYSDQELKEKTKDYIPSMSIYPKEYKDNMPSVIDWFKDRPCVRQGKWMGTKFPFDGKWVIEPIADSTLYPAYYVVSKYVNEWKIKPQEMTEEFFDYVFLGKGNPKNETWERIKKDFEYWYPLDINLGGKEHQTVHFPVFLMNHVGVLDKKNWPKGIFVHWWLTGTSGKISKSKGGAEPIPNLAKNYSVDGMRLYYCHVGSPFVDTVWDPKVAFIYKSQVERLYSVADELLLKTGGMKRIDNWLLSRLHSKLKKTGEEMEKFNMKSPIDIMLFEFLNDLEWYRKRGGEDKETIRAVLDAWLRSLTPFIPHVCEEIWSKFGKDLISTAQWPKAEESKIDKKAEIGEEVVIALESDIKKVIELAKIVPKKITVFTAPEWKRAIYDKAKNIKNANLLIKEVMQDPAVKKYGQEAVSYVQYLGKHSQELLSDTLSASEEIDCLNDAKGYLGKQFKADIVVESADASSNPKAKAAVPFKPAIFVE